MKVYPVPGGEGLRDPRTRRKIPAEGLDVPEDPFWLQRVAHGDVTLELKAVDPETWKPEPGHNLDGTTSPEPGTLAPDQSSS